jgi:hypothetical protein
MENIKDWVKVNDGYGSGYGSGSGSGNADGYGYGYGDGYGSGSYNADGYGSGYGSGDGYGDGYAYGYGSGYGSGSGSGDGSGYKISGCDIYNIDGINTIIDNVKRLVSSGYIVNKDLTQTKTYIVKDAESKYFAHGSTLKQAMESLEEKIVADLGVDERIETFLKDVDKNKKYPIKYFFDWHGKLTGSCLQGRESFIQNKQFNLNDEINLNEFIDLCENQYGWGVIKQIKEELE